MEGDAQIALSWNTNPESDVTGYDLYREGTILASVATASYTDYEVICQTPYVYYVIARDTAGNESTASESTPAATAFDNAPAAPTALAAVAGDGIVTLDWADNTEQDFVEYNVYRGTAAGSYTDGIIATVTGSTFDDESVTNFNVSHRGNRSGDRLWGAVTGDLE